MLLIIRFVISALVLMFVSFLLPGFQVVGFGGALFAAIVIALLGQGSEYFLGKGASPKGRGCLSFIVAGLVIYIAQFIVSGMAVSFFGALLAALIIGIIDLFLPTYLR